MSYFCEIEKFFVWEWTPAMWLFSEVSANTSVCWLTHTDSIVSSDTWTHETDEIIVGNVPPKSLFHVFTWFSQAEIDLTEHS